MLLLVVIALQVLPVRSLPAQWTVLEQSQCRSSIDNTHNCCKDFYQTYYMIKFGYSERAKVPVLSYDVSRYKPGTLGRITGGLDRRLCWFFCKDIRRAFKVYEDLQVYTQKTGNEPPLVEVTSKGPYILLCPEHMVCELTPEPKDERFWKSDFGNCVPDLGPTRREIEVQKIQHIAKKARVDKGHAKGDMSLSTLIALVTRPE